MIAAPWPTTACVGLISECEEDRDAECRDMADLGIQPRAIPPLSRSRDLPARAGADLPRPDLEFSRARHRGAQPRRFLYHLCRRHPGHREPSRERHDPCSGQPLRPSRRHGPARAVRQRQRAYLIYHQWCYGLDGRLHSIPFRRGIRGKGGLDPGFDVAAHGLRKLRVAAVDGALFGTLADDVEPLEDYLGAPVLAQLRRLLERPVVILGYNRQRIRANWKLYAENTRDNYHASLLHEFLVTFGLDRSTQVGGVKMDARHRHNITWAEAESDTAELAQEAYGAARVRSNYLSLKEPELVRFRRERADPLNIAITSVFPSAVFVQISNSLAVRQIRPRGVDEVEVFQTMLGYADDPPDLTL